MKQLLIITLVLCSFGLFASEQILLDGELFDGTSCKVTFENQGPGATYFVYIGKDRFSYANQSHPSKRIPKILSSLYTKSGGEYYAIFGAVFFAMGRYYEGIARPDVQNGKLFGFEFTRHTRLAFLAMSGPVSTKKFHCAERF